MAEYKWYGDKITAQIRKETALRVEYASRSIRDHIRTQLGQQRFPPSGPEGGYPAMRSGHLRRNIQMEMNRALCEGRVGTSVLYGRYLEFGTRGGKIITAAPGKMLRFRGRDGGWVFRKSVKLAPIKPRPWLSRGFREFAPQIKRILETPIGGTI